MKFHVVHQSTSHAHSPFRVIRKSTRREVEWVNLFLDRECLRSVTDTTLRTYAYALLHFLRWWERVHHTADVTQDALTESTLLDYVRFQASQQPPLSGSTINERVANLRLEWANLAASALFVSLKGPARGSRMTPAGLRSLFRYHRRTTSVTIANPHRFRHYASSRTMPP